MSLGDHRLDADEIACVKKLAELYERGEPWVLAPHADAQMRPTGDSLDLPPEKRTTILAVMENLGVISGVQHMGELRYVSFRIDPGVIQTVRVIREQETKKEEPRDIVEQVKTAVRRNRYLAWALIAFFVLVGLSSVVSLVNGLIDLFRKIGAGALAPMPVS